MNKIFTFHYLLDNSENLDEVISFDFDNEFDIIEDAINQLNLQPSEKSIRNILKYANSIKTY